ncbi:hypothetical protein VNO80_29227 [Phaseolus coccineus]|uniref:Uncharacterized protein n=1 Tax=Phaseolus coccineus TaxID=3886 RepID=A0AAN9LAH6_PHACN
MDMDYYRLNKRLLKGFLANAKALLKEEDGGDSCNTERYLHHLSKEFSKGTNSLTIPSYALWNDFVIDTKSQKDLNSVLLPEMQTVMHAPALPEEVS